MFDLGLCLPPSEVKSCFAPSEVHYSQFHLGGRVCHLHVSVLPIRKYLPIFLGRLPARCRPDRMGPVVSGLIMRVSDLPQPESPVL
jgi:hypothetical protein